MMLNAKLNAAQGRNSSFMFVHNCELPRDWLDMARLAAVPMMFVGCIWVQHRESFVCGHSLKPELWELTCLRGLVMDGSACRGIGKRRPQATGSSTEKFAMQCHAPVNCKPGSQHSQLSWYHLQQSILGVFHCIFLKLVLMTSPFFASNFHLISAKLAMLRPPSNWWAALMAACWDAFRKLRTNLGWDHLWLHVHGTSWNVKQRRICWMIFKYVNIKYIYYNYIAIIYIYSYQ